MSKVIGYWDKTWDAGAAPEGATMGIAFSGWVAAKDVLPPGNGIKSGLVGDALLSLGGGNQNGSFSTEKLDGLIGDIQAGTFSDWDGLAFDVEVCDGTGLSVSFAQAFAAVKAQGMTVLVTISHSSPFGCEDGAALMQGFFEDENIDYLSPQLYTTGSETENDYADPVVSWTAYAAAHAAIVPSIVQASMYDSAVSYFEQQGVTLVGFVQWARIAPS